MDDKDREALGGGALGGAVGFALGGPPGAAAGSLLGGVLARQENRHDATLRRAFYAARGATSEGARLYVAGIDPDGARSVPPGEVDGVGDGEPDLVVVDSATRNLVVAVETMARIERDQDDVLAGLEALQVEGFDRVLVVPDSALQPAGEWARARSEAGDLSGSLTVSAPVGLGEELSD